MCYKQAFVWDHKLNHTNLGVETLAHFYTTMRHRDRAIMVVDGDDDVKLEYIPENTE